MTNDLIKKESKLLHLIITIVMVTLELAGVYWGISNKLDLIAQRLDTHIESTAYIPSEISRLDVVVAVLESKIN